MIDLEKTKRVDYVLLIQFLIFVGLIIWLKEIEATLLLGVQFLMGFWLYIIFLKGYRLHNSISAIDFEIESSLEAANHALAGNNIGWKFHIKKINRIHLLLSSILFIVIGTTLIFKVPINIFRNIFLSILFCNIMFYGLSNFIAVQRFFETIIRLNGKIYSSMDKQMRVYNINDLVKTTIEGFLFGVIFIALLYFLSEMYLFHYFLYCLSFSFLYSLSKLLFVTYRQFSIALILIDEIRTFLINQIKVNSKA